MKRLTTGLLLAFILILLFPVGAQAQNGNTTITAIVKDPNGALYVNSQVNVNFYDPGTPGKIPLLCGSTFQTSFPVFGTDSFAAFSISVADNGVIDGCSGTINTQWRFNICYVDRITCFVYQAHIDCANNLPATCTSNVMDISAQLQAVAAILPNQGGSGGAFTYINVPFSPTPNFSSPGNKNAAFRMTLTGDVTSSTLGIAGATAGMIFKYTICQDGAGGHTFSWPPTFNNPPPVNGLANSCTNQTWMFNGTTWDLLSDVPSSSQSRFQPLGTPLISGDFTIPSSNGWGAGATITNITGSDTAFEFTITAGTGPSTNPTIGLTFHDGPWLSIRTVTAEVIGGTGNVADLSATTTLSTVSLTYLGLPINTKTYIFSVLITGLSNVQLAGGVVNPVVINPLAPQVICCQLLSLNAGLAVTGAGIFNSGISGTGNIGLLDLGTTALGTSHTWVGTQIFPLSSISPSTLVPGSNGDVMQTIAGVAQFAPLASLGISINGSATNPVNFNDTTPAAGANFLNVAWQKSGSNASARISISGNTTKVCSVSGVLTSGHLVIVDASGNCVDGGFEQWTSNITSNTCPTGGSTYSTCTYTLTWPSAFASGAYKATCNGVNPSDGRAAVQGITGRSATTITVQIVTNGSLAVSYGGIECHAKL